MRTPDVVRNAEKLVSDEEGKSFPEQQQTPPGLTGEMTPVPDHGEDSWVGRGRLEGLKAFITGADSGIGRAVAIAYAREGADVAIGFMPEEQVDADETARLVKDAGRTAVLVPADLRTQAECERSIAEAVKGLGGLDILVNNAGFVRDRMLVNAEEDEWDAVLRVHLNGHFAPMRHAAAYWRSEAKAGRERAGRVINTSSGAGLQGSVGQAAYSAAKGGIASLTLVAAHELARYGVTVNAIAPSARTRMTLGAFADSMAVPEAGFDAMDPSNVSPIVAWLASAAAADVTGRMIEIEGGRVCVEEGWNHGPALDLGRRWEASEVGERLRELLASAATPERVYGA